MREDGKNPNNGGVIAQTEGGGSGGSPRVIIAGGGTGGHLFPGIAIAQAFIGKEPSSRILFVGAGNAFETTTVKKAGFDHRSIPVEGIKGRGYLKQIKSVLKIPKSMLESLNIIRDFKPDMVIGVGSYSSGPVVFTARLLGVKTALHEQNIIPGITNRILSRFADRIYVSFEETKKRLSPARAILTGNPLRKEIIDASDNNFPAGTPNSGSHFNIMILGGSQGAHKINTAVTEALTLLTNKDKYFFTHQTGNQDEEYVAGAYKKSGIPCEVKPFFEDMGRRYREADLIICRAGAMTVSEITAIGLGAIFIPYPYAADDHQTLNARFLSDSGAADMIQEKDLTAKILSEKIEYYAEHPEELYKMASAAKKFGRPDAARFIVNDFYKIVNSR